jgi:hypothetical protein
MYSIIAVNNKHTAKLHHVGSLYILTYVARKLKHKIVVSPDDGHTVARNVSRKEINVLRKIVHQFGFIYKIVLGGGAARSTEQKIQLLPFYNQAIL